MAAQNAGNLVPCMIPELDLFRKKPVQACIVQRVVEVLKPLTALTLWPDVIEFHSPGRPLHYLDIKNINFRSVIYMRKKVSDDNLLAADRNNSVLDIPLHGMIGSCEIFLSETPVTKWPHSYNYKVTLDLYTSAGKDAIDGQGQCMLFAPDTDANETDSAKNPGFLKRVEPFFLSKKVELIGKLRADVCSPQEGAFILDQVPIRVRLSIKPEDFVLWTGAAEPDVELVMSACELHVPYYVGNPELGMGMELALQREPATYYFKGSQLKTFIHPAGSENILIPTAFSGKLPSTIIFAMLEPASFNGNIKKNPYNFIHAGIQELSFFCNGLEKRFLMNMDIPYGCTAALRSLYDSLGYHSEDAGGHVFNMDGMTKGRFACAVDLTVDQTGRGPSQNVDQFGTVRIQGRLKEALASALCIILYAQYDSVMEITAARDVSVY